jgi:hypothetical protein
MRSLEAGKLPMNSPDRPERHTRENQADSSKEDTYSIHLTTPLVSEMN